MPKDTTPGKPTTRRYIDREKADAVRMVRALWAELGTEHGTVQRVASQLGCCDFTHFPRARRVAVAVLDVVSRRWLSTLFPAEETSSQIEAAFLAALDEEQLAQRIDAPLLAQLRAGQVSPSEIDGPEADGVPALIAMSDNGPQMRSHTTKQFMAACAIMQRFDRPGTPPTRPGSNRYSDTSKATGRTWRRSATQPSSASSWTAPGLSTTPCGCTPASAKSPPTTSTTAAATLCARPATTAWPPPARPALPTDVPSRKDHERAAPLAGYFIGRRPE